MKSISNQGVRVETNLEVHNFSMALGPKIFEILSNGIYSDKILAIIRELSCNAIDSHIESGNKNSYDVYLPSYTDPKFYIRDYGLGMDKEFIEEVYTTYGSSTKDKTNEQIGSFGIGSKSFACYHKKSAVIDSWKDGRHLQYQFFINESGIPSFVNLIDEESSEPNGVKIEFEVHRDDITKFKEKAQYIYQYSIIDPNIINGEKIGKIQYKTKFDGWGIRIADGLGARIIMGGVPYNINQSLFNDTLRRFLNTDIDLYVKIGDLNVDSAREEVSIDKNTELIIERFYQKVRNDVILKIQDDIDKCNNEWEAKCKFIKWTYIIDYSMNINPDDFWFNSIKLSEDRYITKNVSKCNMKVVDNLSKRPQSSKLYHYDFRSDSLVVNDIKSGAVSRCHLLAQNKGEKVILIEEEYIDLVCETLNCDKSNLILASTLEKPAYIKTKRVREKSFGYRYNGDNRVTYAWTAEEIDLEKGGIYIIIDRNNPVDFGIHNLSEGLRGYKRIFKDNISVYGFNKTNAKKLNDKWVNLKDYIKPKLQKECDKYDVNFLYEANRLGNKHSYDDMKLRNLYGVCEHIDEYLDVYKSLEEYDDEFKKVGIILECSIKLNIELEQKKEGNKPPDLDGMKDKIYERYGILKILDERLIRFNKTTISNYINQIKEMENVVCEA